MSREIRKIEDDSVQFKLSDEKSYKINLNSGIGLLVEEVLDGGASITVFIGSLQIYYLIDTE